MDEKIVQKLDEMLRSAPPSDGIGFSCAVRPEELPGFIRRISDWVFEKDPSYVSVSWDGMTVHVKLGFTGA